VSDAAVVRLLRERFRELRQDGTGEFVGRGCNFGDAVTRTPVDGEKAWEIG